MTVAVALIVKNEELTIPRVLASLQGAVDEIIVADTGSTDRTKAVAAAAGAKVVDFPWIGNFAAAPSTPLTRQPPTGFAGSMPTMW